MADEIAAHGHFDADTRVITVTLERLGVKVTLSGAISDFLADETLDMLDNVADYTTQVVEAMAAKADAEEAAQHG